MNGNETTSRNKTVDRPTADMDQGSNDTNDNTDESYRHIKHDPMEENNEQVAHQPRYLHMVKNAPECFCTMRRTPDEDEAIKIEE